MKNNIGTSLNSFIKTKLQTKAIKVNNEKLSAVSKISKVVIVGSSGTGKTTLVDSIRDYCSNTDCVDIPTRYCTRRRRNSDDDENIFVSKSEFIKSLESGKIEGSWTRSFDDGQREYYGFSKTDSGLLPIYSANNGVLRDKDCNLLDSDTLIIGVFCKEDIRHERLTNRDPKHFIEYESELTARLADPADAILGDVHLTIDTTSSDTELTLEYFKKLIKKIEQFFVSFNKIKSTGIIKEKAQGRIFRLYTEEHQLPNGKKVDFEFAERTPGVRILLTDGEHILITKEHRIETSGWDHRLPGGKVWDNLKDYVSESKLITNRIIELAAQKELLEEAGINIPRSSFEVIHKSNCGATVKWDLYYVLVTTPSNFKLRSILTAEGEHVISSWKSNDEVIELCLKGDVSEDRTVSFLLKYLLNYKDNLQIAS